MKLRTRLEALEDRNPVVRRWHRLLVHRGQDVDCVRAAYEAEHGHIGEHHGVIVREVVHAV